MIVEHFNAVRAQIAAATDLTNRVEDTFKRDVDGNLIYDQYVVLFGGGPEVIDDDRATKAQDAASTREFVYTTRCVGITADAVRALSDAVAGQLLGARLNVEGRRLDALRHTGSDPVRPDTTIDPPLYYADDEWTLVSRRPLPA